MSQSSLALSLLALGGVLLLAVDGASVAKAEPAATGRVTATLQAPGGTYDVDRFNQDQRILDNSMAALGKADQAAASGSDLIALNCTGAALDDGQLIYTAAQQEKQLVLDPGSDAQVQALAANKFHEFALQSEGVVTAAQACLGDLSPVLSGEQAENSSNEPRSVPMNAPSLGLGGHNLPGVLESEWPPSATPTD